MLKFFFECVLIVFVGLATLVVSTVITILGVCYAFAYIMNSLFT